MHLWSALYHALIYTGVGVALLVGAYYVLDLLTPGKLGTHLAGEELEMPSRSAGLVASAWLIGNSAILFTAIWTNGDTNLGVSLLWTVVFGAVGILANTVALLAADALTPGNLRAIICEAGPIRNLAYVSAAFTLGISAVVCACIA